MSINFYYDEIINKKQLLHNTHFDFSFLNSCLQDFSEIAFSISNILALSIIF